MEHILQVSDQTLLGDDKTLPYAFSINLDLAAERASTLDLSAIFGKVNNWGGAESIDSDVEMADADTGMSPLVISRPWL